jgi:hypothetical protein
MPIIPVLIEIIPILVQLAEKLIPGGGSDKKQWVVDGVHSFLAFLQSKSPDVLKQIEGALEPLIDALIESAVSKLP